MQSKSRKFHLGFTIVLRISGMFTGIPPWHRSAPKLASCDVISHLALQRRRNEPICPGLFDI